MSEEKGSLHREYALSHDRLANPKVSLNEVTSARDLADRRLQEPQARIDGLTRGTQDSTHGHGALKDKCRDLQEELTRLTIYHDSTFATAKSHYGTAIQSLRQQMTSERDRLDTDLTTLRSQHAATLKLKDDEIEQHANALHARDQKIAELESKITIDASQKNTLLKTAHAQITTLTSRYESQILELQG